MTKKEKEEEIRKCILDILNLYDEFIDSDYVYISNFLKNQYGVTVKNNNICCYEPIATYLDYHLRKECELPFEIEVIRDGYNYWKYYGKF